MGRILLAVACTRISMARPHRAARLGEVDDVGGQRGADVAVRLRGVVQERSSGRQEASRVNSLLCRTVSFQRPAEQKGSSKTALHMPARGGSPW